MEFVAGVICLTLVVSDESFAGFCALVLGVLGVDLGSGFVSGRKVSGNGETGAMSMLGRPPESEGEVAKPSLSISRVFSSIGIRF